MEQYTDGGKNHQRWKLVVVDHDSGEGVYTIENLKSHKALEVLE